MDIFSRVLKYITSIVFHFHDISFVWRKDQIQFFSTFNCYSYYGPGHMCICFHPTKKARKKNKKHKKLNKTISETQYFMLVQAKLWHRIEQKYENITFRLLIINLKNNLSQKWLIFTNVKTTSNERNGVLGILNLPISP